MATSTKIVNKTQTIRRTLRSNAKNLHHQSTDSIDGSQQQKIINQIKIEIDHQQTNNATKFTAPICDEVKIETEILIRKQSLTESSDNKRLGKNECPIQDHHMFSLKPSEFSLQVIENSIEEKIELQVESKKSQQRSLTPRKRHIFKRQVTQISPYFEERKSYRNIKKDPLMTVPYRRFQDQLQQKIVGLINRICQNKHTEKQIDNFIEKLQKVLKKDLYNPYIVSGIQTVLRLCEKTQQINVNSLIKLRNQVKKISQKILNQLSAINEYQTIFHQEKQIDLKEIKPKMLRKIYHILVKQKNMNSSEAKSKSFQACDAIFKKIKAQTTYEQLIQFLKESKFLQY